MICVSVAEAKVDQALAAAKKVERLGDVIEIRLDTLRPPAVSPFMERLHCPLLFTNRSVEEGGAYEGAEVERVSLLFEAIRQGAAYVDIELATARHVRDPLVDAARTSKTKLIMSWHDFKETPANNHLQEVVREQHRTGARIGKVVTMAHSHYDVLRVLNLQILAAELKFPLIAFCMGPIGAISRLATTRLGGFMTYAAPSAEKATAPGQFPLETLQALLAQIPGAGV